MKFIIYKDHRKEFRWRLIGRNGRVIAIAGEGFTRKRNCQKSIVRLCDSAQAKVVDLTVKK